MGLTFLNALLMLSTTGWAQYVLEDDFLAGGNFFNQFSFWDSSGSDGPDPTHGYVNYVNQDVARDNGYIKSTSSGQIYIGTDSVNVTGSSGRNSVRLTSNKSYSSGLVILDLDHMPGGICGTWPAFWMVGPNWPSAGEIDIIEGVNSQSTNAMTLHTGPDCSITNNNAFSGSIHTDNCDINASGQDANAGCSITTTDTQSYGAGFNANNGGVYATNYDSSAISVYFFPRGSIPSDINSGSPNPSSWGKPLAQFQGGCDITSKVLDQQIVFDLTFCGAWAGSPDIWSADSTCSAIEKTCNAFVQNHPEAFKDAYWSINSLKVYQSGGATTSSNIASYSMASTSQSASVAEPSSSSVWAASYNQSASPTTFVVSSKPSPPVFSTGAPVTPPYSSGNATDSSYPSLGGSSAGFPTSVGTVPAASPTTVSVASAPSSPPESVLSSSAAATIEPASSSETPTQTLNWQTHSWHHHHYTPSPQAVRRHLREAKRGFKRHGGGVL